MLNNLEVHCPQIPEVADFPFWSIFSLGWSICCFFLHLKQYAIMPYTCIQSEISEF